MTMVETRLVCGGVDTHSLVHVATVVDHNGGRLGVEEFEVTRPAGEKLLDWMRGFGALIRGGRVAPGPMASTSLGISRPLVSRSLRSTVLIGWNATGQGSRPPRRDGRSPPRYGPRRANRKGRTRRVEAMRVLGVAKRSA